VVRDSERCLVVPLSREVEGEEEIQRYRFRHFLPKYFFIFFFIIGETMLLLNQWNGWHLI